MTNPRDDLMATQVVDREARHGAHLFATAKSLGWLDDGEGPLEFMIRRTREVAFEDAGKPVTSFPSRPATQVVDREAVKRALIAAGCDSGDVLDAVLSLIRTEPSAALVEAVRPMSLYYKVQNALSPHMGSSTELMSAMSSIWPFIEETPQSDTSAAEMRERCARLKVSLYGIGGRSSDYLQGFEDACRAYIDAIRQLPTAIATKALRAREVVNGEQT